MALLCWRLTQGQVETHLAESVSSTEWAAELRHRLYPDIGKAVGNMVIGRKGVSKERLKGICDNIGAPGKVQQMAFGRRIYKSLGGCVHKLDLVDRILPLNVLVKEYLEILEAFLGDDPDFPPDSERSRHHSTDVRGAWCCRKVHIDSRHKYMRCGGVAGETVMRLMKVLTNKDIKLLAGLDNVQVVQGYENFLTLRRVVPSLEALAGKAGEVEELLGKVYGLELFMKTYF